jgi:hypothetical protein
MNEDKDRFRVTEEDRERLRVVFVILLLVSLVLGALDRREARKGRVNG